MTEWILLDWHPVKVEIEVWQENRSDLESNIVPPKLRKLLDGYGENECIL